MSMSVNYQPIINYQSLCHSSREMLSFELRHREQESEYTAAEIFVSQSHCRARTSHVDVFIGILEFYFLPDP